MTTREEATRTHTPGPWEVRRIATKYPALWVYNVEAPAGWTDPQTGEVKLCSVAFRLDSEADARLIAAAPEMLALLRNVVEDMDTIADHLSSLGKVARGSRVYISALIARISALIARIDGAEGS